MGDQIKEELIDRENSTEQLERRRNRIHPVRRGGGNCSMRTRRRKGDLLSENLEKGAVDVKGRNDRNSTPFHARPSERAPSPEKEKRGWAGKVAMEKGGGGLSSEPVGKNRR